MNLYIFIHFELLRRDLIFLKDQRLFYLLSEPIMLSSLFHTPYPNLVFGFGLASSSLFCQKLSEVLAKMCKSAFTI